MAEGLQKANLREQVIASFADVMYRQNITYSEAARMSDIPRSTLNFVLNKKRSAGDEHIMKMLKFIERVKQK